ncbi:MAG TPA: AI-2E family transporter [Pantanalinema sp.]
MGRNWAETFYKLASILLILVLCYIGWQATGYFQDVLTVLVSAILVAYVLQMAVEPLSRRMPRWLAVLLVVVAFVVLVGAAVSLAVPLVLNQLQMILVQLPAGIENLQDQLDRLNGYLASRHLRSDLRIDAWVLPRLEGLGQSVASNLPGLLMGSFSGFFSGAMILVCSFYFLKDGSRLWRALLDALPSRASLQATYLQVELEQSLNRYVRGQLINAGVVLAAASTAFSLLGMNYGIVAGLIWGLAEIIPYFGLYLGLGTAVFLAMLQGGPVVGKVILAGLVIWWTKDNIIAPRVMSHTTGLHPILIIAAVLMGGKLAGFLGILLAIPIMAVVVTTLRFWLQQQRARELGPVEPPQPVPSAAPVPEA